MGVFMVAPNMFDAVPEAQRGPACAPTRSRCSGEIVASQTGAARAHDTATLQRARPARRQAAWPSRSPGSSRSAGSPAADRTQFGDGSPNAVYRGLGRGLAG